MKAIRFHLFQEDIVRRLLLGCLVALLVVACVQSAVAGSLIGYRWSGSTEEIVSIDPNTGSSSVIATLGLMWVQGVFTVNSAEHKAYLFATRDGLNYEIDTIDLITGNFRTVPIVGMEHGGFGFAAYGKNDLIAYRWNGSNEELISIDPRTGAFDVITAVDLDWVLSPGPIAVDPAHKKAYLYGQKDGETFWRIYTVDLKTRTVTSVPMTEAGGGGFGFDFYEKDTLVGYRWNGMEEEIISIDARTGATSVIAKPDLLWVQGVFAVNSAEHKAYLHGSRDGISWSIYAIDLKTGEVSSVPIDIGQGGFCFDTYAN